MAARKIILKLLRAVGDTVVFTAVVRDLKRLYGEQVLVDVRTNFPETWYGNPHLTFISEEQEHPEIYDFTHHAAGITLAGRGEKLHFTTWFHRDLTAKSGLQVWPTESKPDLYLTDGEKAQPPVEGRYWVLFAGGKTDATVKHWEYARYQELVDRLRLYGLKFVQTGAVHNDRVQHIHPPLQGVLNLVGWGGIRELFWQIYHAEGVICPITSGMHIAGAFDKPCVVIAGGREEPWWEEYSNGWEAFGDKAAPVKVPHRYLHTLGMLPCCAAKGCWKKKVVPIDDDQTLCWRPMIKTGHQPLPECMSMISTDAVVGAVLSYYQDGTLPPP